MRKSHYSPVYQEREDDCGYAVMEWIARLMDIPERKHEIEQNLRLLRLARLGWGTYPGTFGTDPGVYFAGHGHATGSVCIPIQPNRKLEAITGVSFGVAKALFSAGSGMLGWYGCRGVAKPDEQVHLRAVAFGKIMCPRLGIMPLTERNFHRLEGEAPRGKWKEEWMRGPGPHPESWTLGWVMR